MATPIPYRRGARRYTPQQLSWLRDLKRRYPRQVPWRQVATSSVFRTLFPDTSLDRVKQRLHNLTYEDKRRGVPLPVRRVTATPVPAAPLPRPQPMLSGLNFCPCCGEDLRPYLLAAAVKGVRHGDEA